MEKCIHKELKLPRAKNITPVKCVKISMDNEKEYTVKQDDLVAIQFIKGNLIVVRRGRIKDIVVINSRELSAPTDNVSHIILDCSQQFSVKILEIKFTDIIAIGNIDDEFEDYNDRIEKLEPNHMSPDGCKIPTRHHGMHTKKDCPITPRGIPLRK